MQAITVAACFAIASVMSTSAHSETRRVNDWTIEWHTNPFDNDERAIAYSNRLEGSWRAETFVIGCKNHGYLAIAIATREKWEDQNGYREIQLKISGHAEVHTFAMREYGSQHQGVTYYTLRSKPEDERRVLTMLRQIAKTTEPSAVRLKDLPSAYFTISRRGSNRAAKAVTAACEDKVGTYKPRASLGTSTKEAQGGLSVVRVWKNTAAEAAGLKIGDVIMSLNGERVTNARTFAERIRSFPPNAKVALGVTRGKGSEAKLLTIEVTLGSFD